MSNRIAESELIINERGAVYHLDIRPEELADTVITVGDPGRVPLISRHFDKIEFQNAHREFVSHTGYIGKKRLTVLSSGIGPDNIDIVMNELDALANIDFATREIKPQLKSLQIVRIGTSGSLQADIPVDSFVAGTHGLGLDNVLNFYRHDNNEQENELIGAFITHTNLDNYLTPYISMAGPSLLKHFVEGYHQGITVTCPGFFGPQGRVLRLGLTYPLLVDQLTTFGYGPYRISNFEMETSAIYGLGKLLGHQCLSVNAIIANRIAKTFTKNAAATMNRLIAQTLEILSQI
ncbi:MAG: nucleoside phosphorylase [Chitinophagaceae bacterium]